MAKLEELELKIKALKLEIELIKLKENYPQTKPHPEYYPKYPDRGTEDYYPVWYPQTICLDVNLWTTV